MDNSDNIDDPLKVPIEDENSWLQRFVIYAAKNPYEFCWYLLLGLSPLFFISAFLSWKLAKAIDAQEKEKNKRSKRAKNINKVKRGKSD
ncbi:Small integral membrane protein 15 [Armadillidium vulgare]|uniref:Small integral membrane protein 15 n=1 Tax=Armadillidium nasatum TaxID=96803 RepID=A0A5N5SN39_9CRUS|nr:Small integral membrane protein 15 [Armadillidium nasatum]RXG73545.1 Small integral membrane protein 15 [Armadillidium vulgare]